MVGGLWLVGILLNVELPLWNPVMKETSWGLVVEILWFTKVYDHPRSEIAEISGCHQQYEFWVDPSKIRPKLQAKQKGRPLGRLISEGKLRPLKHWKTWKTYPPRPQKSTHQDDKLLTFLKATFWGIFRSLNLQFVKIVSWVLGGSSH